MFGKRLAIALFFIIVFAFAALGSTQAFADRGGKKAALTATGSSSSFSLVLLNSADGLSHWGQPATFTFSSTATYPSVLVDCFQSGVLVYQQGASFWTGYSTPVFTFKSWMWTGGDADCNATLLASNADGSNVTTLATTSFHVYQ